MSSLVREARTASSSSREWTLLVGVGFVAALTFLLIPGDLVAKTHLALHGICAQRPSHSLRLGDSALPLDARMTGMYIAAVANGVWLVAAGRVRRTKPPPRSVFGVLGLFILVLTGDGFNALAFDLGLPHPYEPSNALRLATGVLGGTTLAVGVAYLFAMSIWADGERHAAIVQRPIELLVPLGVAGALSALVLSGLPVLYAPYAVGLLIAAILVFALMGMIFLTLVTDRGWSFSAFSELGPFAVGGVVVALLVIGGLSWLRLVAESRIGLLQLT